MMGGRWLGDREVEGGCVGQSGCRWPGGGMVGGAGSEPLCGGAEAGGQVEMPAHRDKVDLRRPRPPGLLFLPF